MRTPLFLLLIASATIAYAGGPNGDNPSFDQYIVMFKDSAPGQPPLTDDDVSHLGGKVEYRHYNRVVVRLPAPAVEQLKKHGRVKYIQKTVAGEQPVILPGSSGTAASMPPALTAATAALRTGLPSSDTTPPVWSSGTYLYDGAGNIYATQGSGNTSVYTYDGRSRITSADIHTPNVTRAEQYAYDDYGNLLSVKVDAEDPLSFGVDSATNRVPQNCDQMGNCTPGRSMMFDPFGLATDETSGGQTSATYLYTASDERIGALSGYDWTWSVRDFEGKVVRQYASDAADYTSPWVWVQDYVYRDGQLLASSRVNEEGAIRDYHLDHLGSPRLVTGRNGERIAEHDYTPFGVQITSIGQEKHAGFDRDDPMKFTGHERDYLGGTFYESSAYLDYMHARFYKPTMGRFLSVDPTLESVSPSTPQSWNRYAYALNNGMSNVDPDGRCTFRNPDGSIHTDNSLFCVESTPSPHWSAAELRAQADTANERTRAEFLDDAKAWGSVKATFARGRGGSVTYGQSDGQTFFGAQAGVGYAAGVKWDPAGRLPMPTPGWTPPRAFLGVTSSLSLSVGPLGIDLPLRAGVIIYTDASGRTRVVGSNRLDAKGDVKVEAGIRSGD
jgi:RHS repeat-associated protein